MSALNVFLIYWPNSLDNSFISHNITHRCWLNLNVSRSTRTRVATTGGYISYLMNYWYSIKPKNGRNDGRGLHGSQQSNKLSADLFSRSGYLRFNEQLITGPQWPLSWTSCRSKQRKCIDVRQMAVASHGARGRSQFTAPCQVGSKVCCFSLLFPAAPPPPRQASELHFSSVELLLPSAAE